MCKNFINYVLVMCILQKEPVPNPYLHDNVFLLLYHLLIILINTGYLVDFTMWFYMTDSIQKFIPANEINPAFLDGSFCQSEALGNVIGHVIQNPQASLPEYIGSLNGRSFQLYSNRGFEFLYVLLKKIFHSLRCTFSADYYHRFLTASEKVTQSLKELSCELQEDNQEGQQLEGLELLQKELKIIKRSIDFQKERKAELNQIGDLGVVRGAVTENLEGVFFKRQQEELRETLEEVNERLGVLKPLFTRYKELLNLYKAIPDATSWDYFWNSERFRKHAEIEGELWECVLEIRKAIYVPFSSELELSEEEMKTCQSEISLLRLRKSLISEKLSTEYSTEETMVDDDSQPIPLLTKQRQMLQDLCTHIHPELAVIWTGILNKYPNEEVVQDWILREDGSFTIQLARPLYLWTPNEQFIGGAVITLGDKNHRIEGRLVKTEFSQLEKVHKNQVQGILDRSNEWIKAQNQALAAANPGVEQEILAAHFKQPLPQPSCITGMIYTSGLGSYVNSGMYLSVDVVHMLHMGYPVDCSEPNIIVSAGKWFKWSGTIDSFVNIKESWSHKAIAIENDIEQFPFLNNPKVKPSNFYQYFLEHKVNESKNE